MKGRKGHIGGGWNMLKRFLDHQKLRKAYVVKSCWIIVNLHGATARPCVLRQNSAANMEMNLREALHAGQGNHLWVLKDRQIDVFSHVFSWISDLFVQLWEQKTWKALEKAIELDLSNPKIRKKSCRISKRIQWARLEQSAGGGAPAGRDEEQSPGRGGRPGRPKTLDHTYCNLKYSLYNYYIYIYS